MRGAGAWKPDAVDLGQASDCFCSQCMARSNPESARFFCCWTFGDNMTQPEACERVVENTGSPKSSISILYDDTTLYRQGFNIDIGLKITRA